MPIGKRITHRIVSSIAIVALLSSCGQGIKNLPELREKNAYCEYGKLYSHVVTPERPISLNMAIQMALTQNLRIRMQEKEQEIQREIASAEKLKMLPSLSVDHLHDRRNSEPITTSESILGVASDGSQSTERETDRLKVEMAWNLLDFGITYYRVRQEKDRLKTIQQQQMRVRQTLVLETVEAYWTALVARQTVVEIERLIGLAKERQEVLKKHTENSTVNKIEGLETEDRLLDMQLRLRGFQSEYRSARAELATLMGLRPDAHFELADIDFQHKRPGDIDIRELEYEALLSRPELYEQDIREHMAADEARTWILRMLPSPRLFANYTNEQNRFLVHQEWATLGVQTTWDLLTLPSKVSSYRSAKAQEYFIRQSRLALSVGVITQVHLAYLKVADTEMEYKLSRDLYLTRKQLLDVMKREHALGQVHAAQILDYESEALFAKITALRAYADMQVSLERLANSVGKPLMYSDLNVDNDLVDSMQTGEEQPDTTTSTTKDSEGNAALKTASIEMNRKEETASEPNNAAMELKVPPLLNRPFDPPLYRKVLPRYLPARTAPTIGKQSSSPEGEQDIGLEDTHSPEETQ